MAAVTWALNLRSAGDQHTLALDNGCRFGGEDTPDIGVLPPGAIRDIEILNTGSSAIYGSDTFDSAGFKDHLKRGTRYEFWIDQQI